MKRIIYILAALMAAAAIATAATRSPKRKVADQLQVFNSLMKELQTFYVDTIDVEQSVQTAIVAMLDDIDPYTEYIPAEDKADFRSVATGEYGGIGSYIMERDGAVYVSGPSEGSPSDLAGLRHGDRFVRIDTSDVAGWSSARVSEALKGTPGTHVTVTVKRPYPAPGADSLLTVDIVRRKIQMPSVPYHGMLADSVTGYIYLSSFTDKSPDEVRSALADLKGRGAKALVLDLRGNGGGLLESAVKILGYFLPKGTEVLRTRGRGVLAEKIYKTQGAPVDVAMPLAVLIDGGSASASEIVAGALQDLDRAVIVGSRSFGKGLVQSTRSLPLDGMLKVTTAKYYIPSGRLIQAIDYSRRNPDGSVARIPDSLTRVWHTAGGREVRDGGGITPDIAVDYPDISRLTYNLVRDNWVFDFATLYASQHPAVPEPARFCVTDTIYAAFKAFIDPARLNYDKVCETLVDQLRRTAASEGYMTDSVSAQIDRLAALLRHDLDHDLDINRPQIEPYLASEIMSRYYYRRGDLENSLLSDHTVDSAATVMAAPARYRSILRK